MDNKDFISAFTKDTIKSADMCWTALKTQLNTHNPNKQEVEKLKNAMIKFVKDLAIIST